MYCIRAQETHLVTAIFGYHRLQKKLNFKSGANSKTTRKPCYRKDDRAKCPIYGCPEKFRDFLATPTATFPEIVNGLLLQSIVQSAHKI